jgi:hypothetical protein
MLNTKFIRHKVRGFVLWDAITEISHLDMVQRLGFAEHEIHSAGFVGVDATGQPYCTGNSGSLNLGSTAADTPALRRQLGLPAPQAPAVRLHPTIVLGGGAAA